MFGRLQFWLLNPFYAPGWPLRHQRLAMRLGNALSDVRYWAWRARLHLADYKHPAAQESEAVLIARLEEAIFEYANYYPLGDVLAAATAAIDNLKAEEKS